MMVMMPLNPGGVFRPEAPVAQSPEEVVPETPAHEAVDDGVEGAVEVGHEDEGCFEVLGEALQLGAEDPEALQDVDDEVGAPAEHKDQDDDDQHADHTPEFPQRLLLHFVARSDGDPSGIWVQGRRRAVRFNL